MVISNMRYECVDCGYTTDKKFNFEKHKDRKTTCKRDLNLDNKGKQNVNLIAHFRNDGAHFRNDGAQNSNDEHICNKCDKKLSNIFSLRRHVSKCKGVDNLTCEKCFKKFSSVASKNNHKRNVNCSSLSETKINDETTQGNATNVSYGVLTNGNHNNTNVQNITINSFGNENLNHLIQDKDIIYKTNNFSKKGVYGLVDIIDHIYLNPEHPENNTIIKLNEKGDDVLVMNESNTWEYREYEDVKDQFVEALNNFLRIYNKKKNELNIKLVEQKERNRIKEFIIFLMTIGGIIEDDLAEELNVDDDYIINEEKINNKFDKATLSKLFFKSNLFFNKSDKKIKRI